MQGTHAVKPYQQLAKESLPVATSALPTVARRTEQSIAMCMQDARGKEGDADETGARRGLRGRRRQSVIPIRRGLSRGGAAARVFWLIEIAE